MKFWKSVTTAAATAALLAACGNQEVAEPEELDEPAIEEDAGTDDTLSEEDVGSTESELSFDPESTVPLAEKGMVPFGADPSEEDEVFPFENLPDGINFDVPTNAVAAQWETPDDGWVGNSEGDVRNGLVQFHVANASIEELETFVNGQLDLHGWEEDDSSGIGEYHVEVPVGGSSMRLQVKLTPVVSGEDPKFIQLNLRTSPVSS